MAPLAKLLGICVLLLHLISHSNQELSPPSSTTPKNYDIAPKCCVEPNILLRNCTAPKPLDCKFGSYLVMPHVDATDEFEIQDDGTLLIHDKINEDKYCISLFPDNETHYIAQVCFNEDLQSAGRGLYDLKGLLSFISVTFIGLTLYVYNVIVMRDTQDRVVRWTLICLLLFYLTLSVILFFSELMTVTGICTAFGFITHFFCISYFAWVNTVMANVWKAVVVPRWAIKESKWYMWNHIYAWCVPLFITLVALFGHFTEHSVLHPKIGHNSCWFGDDATSQLYVYTPMTIMVAINIILFLWTCIVLHRYGNDYDPERKNSLKYRVIMYLKLFLIVGITWIFEILSFIYKDLSFWLFTDIFNSLQGLLLFLVLVMFRPRVKRELAGKKLFCCLHAPEHWQTNANVEHQRLNENDEEDSDPYTNDLIIKG